MLRAVGTGLLGAGVTLASTFAASLGLSLQQQRIGFAIGVVLILIGVALFFSGRRQPTFGSDDEKAVFVATEAEIALAHQEVVELLRLLLEEWPYITPKGQDLEQAISDWRLKTTDFITGILGPARRAAFMTAGAGQTNTPDQLEAEGDFLRDLALKLTPGSIRADKDAFLEARATRRQSQAANFVDYEHYRAPGAPPAKPGIALRKFGRRDDPGDLAKRCQMLAGSVARWVGSFNSGHSERAERIVREWLEADPTTDETEARRKAYSRDEKSWERDYRLKFGAEAKKLFEEAWEMHEIARELEQLATRPLAVQFEEVPKLFSEIAESLYANAA